MGGFGYDRQVFVKPKNTPPPPRGRSPLPGALVLILVAVLGAFAAYRYIKAGGLSNVDPDTASNAQVKQLQHKIKVLQARIHELEGARRAARPKPAPEPAKPHAAKSQLPPVVAEQLAHRPPVHLLTAPAQKQLHDDTPTLPEASAADKAKTDPNLKALQGAMASSHQEWEATVNRLGNVVGELDAQRSQLRQNQNDVNQLLQITRRTGVPFKLRKGSRFQRVGPISMKLASTDVSNQRYTLRLIVDDKSVELKNRALNEVIQFYTARSQFPVELVVSQIQRGRVSGMLAVPSDLNSGNQNAQMQTR